MCLSFWRNDRRSTVLSLAGPYDPPSLSRRCAREVLRLSSHHHVGEERIPGRFRETVFLAAAHFRDGSHKVSAYILGLNPNTFWYSSIMMPLVISANSSATITLS